MLDFLIISEERNNKGYRVIFPSFRTYPKSKDLMIRGQDFYAIWVEEKGFWSTDESDAFMLIDTELDKYVEAMKDKFDSPIKVLHIKDSRTKMVDAWHAYVKRQLRDSYHLLDAKVLFSNSQVKKNDYATRTLPYPLQEGEMEAYDKLMSTLYSPEERHKIEWAIGAIISGDSKKIQKFLVLYGAGGTGKSTVLNIISSLFEGYCASFDSKALASSTNQFALESLSSNPLVAIQHDGDLSRIEDNTKINSIVSHEKMVVNEKFKNTYSMDFNTFLFMGTNKPVQITDSKSGIIRRLIDVSPTGNLIPRREYDKLKEQLKFELGAIAKHCLDVYKESPDAYDKYIPLCMLGATNDFYNFMEDRYFDFAREDKVTQALAWEWYNEYIQKARVMYPLSLRVFKEELRTYFSEFHERTTLEDGTRVRKLYSGFRKERFSALQSSNDEQPQEEAVPKWLELTKTKSLLDDYLSDSPAQYANLNGTPIAKWANVTTTLSELDTYKLHYVKPKDQNLICIDFDIKDANGNKLKDLNIKAASKWPKTYAEFSKSGAGIHLYYIYDGDVSELSGVVEPEVECKVFTGNSSLRRLVTYCNGFKIAHINSGLPKKEKRMTNFEGFENEKALRTFVLKCLNNEYEPHHTAPSIKYIHSALEDAYNKGLKYDLTSLKTKIQVFAEHSTNQKDTCLALVSKMKFKSEEPSESIDIENNRPYVFFDVECAPNLFLIKWMYDGQSTMNTLVNPTPMQVSKLFEEKLIGFNNRRYDNHMLWAASLGYTTKQLSKLSQDIIVNHKGLFAEAYSISYTDIYDFSSDKKSLKKWEIELGIHHQEMGIKWDEDIPEELWPKVEEYCENDVRATRELFYHLKGDWEARQILAAVTNSSVNDSTNSLSAKFIFGNDKNPQKEFNYRFMGDESTIDILKTNEILDGFKARTGYSLDPDYTKFDSKGRPVFPGYTYEGGKSMYRGMDVGNGGLALGNPGIWYNVMLLDIASMHPSSAIAEELFGPRYTKRFAELKQTRIYIKHRDYESAKTALGGVLRPFIEKEGFNPDDLAQALKIVINAVYGLTAANFDNRFRDIRNKDNIVAKRGALFMCNLMHEVENLGFTVAHIKTDSIKVPNANHDIRKFIIEYGKIYGYDFEHEATYDRMCLVNDAVYIAKYATIEQCNALYSKEYVDSAKDILKDNKKHPGAWTATGTQFQVPFVFKTLFSKEPLEFKDYCETKAVSTALYLKGEDDSDPEFIGKVGLFCPIKKTAGGKELVRESEDKDGNRKFGSATGAKGYLWLEAEQVAKIKDYESVIDLSYYTRLTDEAKETISQYGDFEAFVSDDKDDDVPWDIPEGTSDSYILKEKGVKQ